MPLSSRSPGHPNNSRTGPRVSRSTVTPGASLGGVGGTGVASVLQHFDRDMSCSQVETRNLGGAVNHEGSRRDENVSQRRPTGTHPRGYMFLTAKGPRDVKNPRWKLDPVARASPVLQTPFFCTTKPHPSYNGIVGLLPIYRSRRTRARLHVWSNKSVRGKQGKDRVTIDDCPNVARLP